MLEYEEMTLIIMFFLCVMLEYEEMTKCVDPGPEPFKNCSDSYQTSTHRAVKQYSKAGQLQEAFCR